MRHGELRRVLHAFFQQHADDFGDHVTRPAHDHGVAYAHILAARLVFVVQRGVGDGDPAHKHGRQLGHRRELAGAANLHLDGLHGGELLLRRVLVRHGPARLTRDKAHLFLQRQAVDLVDHTVDVVRQAVALLADGLMERYQFRSANCKLCLGCNRKTP